MNNETRLVRRFGITAAVILLTACTSAPPAPTPAAVQVAAAPQVAAAAAGVPIAPTPIADSDQTLMLAKKAHQYDYQVQNRDGHRFYCHTGAALGSRFESKKCVDEPTFEEVVRNAEVTSSSKWQSSCNGANCIHH
jgi:hypothetical protein